MVNPIFNPAAFTATPEEPKVQFFSDHRIEYGGERHWLTMNFRKPRVFKAKPEIYYSVGYHKAVGLALSFTFDEEGEVKHLCLHEVDCYQEFLEQVSEGRPNGVWVIPDACKKGVGVGDFVLQCLKEAGKL